MRLTAYPAFATMRRFGWQGVRPGQPLSCQEVLEGIHAHRQSACAQRPGQAEVQDQDPCPPRRSAEARRVHARVHDDAKEAELGSAEGRPRPADQRHGGIRYKVIRAALETAGVSDRKQGRSKYGAKKGS